MLLGAKKLPADNRQLLMQFASNRADSILVVRRMQEVLADAEHIAGAHGQDNIARAGNAAQLGLDLRERRVEFRTRDLRGQIGRRNADGVFLARSVNLRQIDDRRAAELLDKIVEELRRAAVGMRLEHDDRALIVERIDRIEQRTQLARMVRIIVIQIRALELALIIKPARPYLTAFGLTPSTMAAAVAASALRTLWMPGTWIVTWEKRFPR